VTGALAGLALPVLATWLVLRAWRLDAATPSALVTAAVAFGVGVGLSALTTIWMLALGLRLGPSLQALDALLWVALAAAAWRRLRAAPPRRQTPPGAGERSGPWVWAARAAFAAVAGVALLTLAAEYAAQPHGQWDAWAIWNQKARFLFRGGPQWTAMLGVDFANPGHPLLVPAAVARLWMYAGGELTAVPALLASLFGVAAVAIVMGALGLDRARAWVAGAVLLAPAGYLKQVVSQQADVPVGFFIVATLALLRRDQVAAWLDEGGTRATLLLAGMLAGFAAWTKNEGLVMLGIATLLVGWIVLRHGRPRQAAWWVVGAVPAGLTVLWFKLLMAPVAPQYLDENSGTMALLADLFSPERHATVWPLVWCDLSEWGGARAAGVAPAAIAVALAAACTRDSRAARGLVAAVALMLAVYYAVYLVSPLDIVWPVDTTVGRLLAQLWPVLVLAAFSWTGRVLRIP
jgi:hypothetical protein